MYPLNMTDGNGFAVANNAEEHKRLTAMGYGPGLSAETEVEAAETVESLRAKLDAAGIAYDKRWGLAKLQDAAKEIA